MLLPRVRNADQWLDDQFFGLLATAFASDGQGGLYMHPKPDFGKDYAWLHIGENGEILVEAPFWQILASSSGTCLLLSLSENRLRIHQFPAGSQRQIQLPELATGQTWQTYGLSAQEEPILERRDQLCRFMERIVLRQDGSFPALEGPQIAEIAALQATATWISTAEGMILPLRTAAGLQLILVREN